MSKSAARYQLGKSLREAGVYKSKGSSQERSYRLKYFAPPLEKPKLVSRDSIEATRSKAEEEDKSLKLRNMVKRSNAKLREQILKSKQTIGNE